MPLTLAEGAKLSNDVVLQGVIETIVRDSPILQRLPFIDIVGNGLTYNRETAGPVPALFYQVGDTWVEASETFTQVTAPLVIMGTDADVDSYLQKTRSNIQDLAAAVIELRAKRVRYLFEDTFVNGDTAVDVKSFDGVTKVITGAQRITMGTNGATLSLSKLDELIDLIRGGPPDLLLMSRRTRRTLNALVRQVGTLIETRNEFGMMQSFYNGIPIGISDFVSDTQTKGTSISVASSVYALRFGEDAISGLQGAGGLQVEDVGELETKDAHRYRIKWYVSMAYFGIPTQGVLDGVLV